MAEVLVDFETPVRYGDDIYNARAVGRFDGSHMWEGWLEFFPRRGGPAVTTGVESTQPERGHLVYWATGLTAIYLAGALSRAMRPTPVQVRFEGTPEAVLNPFDIGERSLDILRQELTALNRPRLLNIIAAHALNRSGEDLSWMSDAQLVTFIVTAVEAQLVQRLR